MQFSGHPIGEGGNHHHSSGFMADEAIRQAKSLLKTPMLDVTSKSLASTQYQGLPPKTVATLFLLSFINLMLLPVGARSSVVRPIDGVGESV